MVTEAELQEYATYCGPQALAAIAGLSPTAAAAALVAAAEAMGEPAPKMSTPRELLLRTLKALRYDVDPLLGPGNGWRVGELVRALPGDWLIILEPDDDGPAHAMAVRDGRVIAGEDRPGKYDGNLIRWAYHLTRREG